MPSRLQWSLAPTLASMIIAGMILAAPADATCVIASSQCYPWRIEADKPDAVLLEIVPNSVSTVALYRVCLCPPASGVSLVFEFDGRSIVLGNLELGSGEPICRDYRIATVRKSRLLVKRAGAANGQVEGCYTTQ